MDGPMNHDLALELAAGYVLGALDPAEEQAVRDHLASCPEPHEEFAELGSVVPALAETVELVEPPASLKQRVLAAAAADLAARRAAEAAVPAPAAPAPAVPPAPPEPVAFPSAEERAARAATSRGTWLLRIAAVIAIVALGASNILLLTRPEPSSVAFADAVSRVLEAAGQPGSQTAILSATEQGRPRGLATITADGSVVLALQGLAPTSGTEVYEAWVIGADGIPVAIGGFQVAAGETASVVLRDTPATAGVTLALTREPAPGATVPTEPILSVGQATGSS
jgi:hypothetical protein